MIRTIPLDNYPNQTLSTTINGDSLTITLITRLGLLYATVESRNEGLIVSNRVCLDRVPITQNLIFIDIEGNQNPSYDGLNGRFLLVWADES